ncbi:MULTISPECIES: hypothetical protein [unclassified Streptomyces]|uniref:hypothetical protein n=1 Tax=unclassified Streptomyces TaxID=2593676 RepID=UPI00087CB327|nr:MULTISPECIES: hypothetical protein [unclassified Streptomyces]REH20339.1 hypothetical protein BX268_2118 [Streptomyces sp. 2221.1]SDT21006.1 hypothetical protein SAMN05428941_2116 [Streptomyces sp. 2114.2]
MAEPRPHNHPEPSAVVLAMLRAFLRTAAARARSRAPRLAQDDDVLLDAPDDRLAPALVAAAHGEHGPAARLLAGTRHDSEWDHRDRYATRLAAFARFRSEWLDTWRATAPDDPDALLVAARLAVHRHWDSPARTELLRQVIPSVVAAAETAGPADPVPWRTALDAARGAGAEHAEFERLWEQAVRRSPHHYGSHVAALEYLAAASSDGHGECLDFAETAAQEAPEEALVRALPLHAAFTCLTATGTGTGTGTDARTGGATTAAVRTHRPRLDAAADRAITLSAAHPAADPWAAELRNLLVYVLVRLERHQDAAEQLRLTGPYVTSFPWDRDTDDPLGGFLRVRADVRAHPGEAAAATGTAAPGRPRNGYGERVRPGDH